MNKFGVFLIFLSIIILCAAVLFIINPLKMLADHNDTIRINDLQKISVALEKYHADYGSYPESIAWGEAWEPYMSLVPKDPDSNRKYAYISDSTGDFQSFRLYASLENPTPEKHVCGVTEQCPSVPAKNLCGENMLCNFAVTSSNTSP